MDRCMCPWKVQESLCRDPGTGSVTPSENVAPQGRAPLITCSLEGSWELLIPPTFRRDNRNRLRRKEPENIGGLHEQSWWWWREPEAERWLVMEVKGHHSCLVCVKEESLI